MTKPLNPWNLPDLKAGQNLTCRIEKQERDGYLVTIEKEELLDFPGFLPTEEPLKIGDQILAQFVCVSNNRILLTPRFSAGNVTKKPIPYVSWEEKFQEMDGTFPPNEDLTSTANTQTNLSQLSEEEAAFHVWAQQITPPKVPLRRATDLLLPPLSAADVQTFTIADHDIEWLITDLEGGMRSGCLKASCDSVLSRSGMLLYRGRCVGCIYSSKTMPDSPEHEEALAYTLNDMRLPDTKITLYDLPENLVLSSSALFLGQGQPSETNRQSNVNAHFDYILSWLEQQKHTACLCISLNVSKPPKHAFVYIYRGHYVGVFSVEDQGVTKEKSRVYEILAEDPHAEIKTRILPPEMTSSAIRFGYSLSVTGKR